MHCKQPKGIGGQPYNMPPTTRKEHSQTPEKAARYSSNAEAVTA